MKMNGYGGLIIVTIMEITHLFILNEEKIF